MTAKLFVHRKGFGIHIGVHDPERGPKHKYPCYLFGNTAGTKNDTRLFLRLLRFSPSFREEVKAYLAAAT